MDINLKANVVNSLMDGEDAVYGYIVGACICAYNGDKDRYDKSFELADVIATYIFDLFIDLNTDGVDIEDANIEISTDNYDVLIMWASGLNDIDIMVKNKEK